MTYEDQTVLLKRLLRYARRNCTDMAKIHAALVTEKGRSGPVLRLEGKQEAWEQMIHYMETLTREVGIAAIQELDAAASRKSIAEEETDD